MIDLLDASSRNRIVTDLSQSLIVEAGAGSGKTHEMARRMAAGIAAGVYQVERMAAVTFTRKAAAELRGRFQNLFLKTNWGLAAIWLQIPNHVHTLVFFILLPIQSCYPEGWFLLYPLG